MKSVEQIKLVTYAGLYYTLHISCKRVSSVQLINMFLLNIQSDSRNSVNHLHMTDDLVNKLQFLIKSWIFLVNNLRKTLPFDITDLTCKTSSYVHTT